MTKYLTTPPLAFAIALSATATPLVAETEPALPRLLVLQSETEATLPGDNEGALHGVVVNRGSGFPAIPHTVAPAEERVEVAPAPTRRRVTRRARRW